VKKITKKKGRGGGWGAKRVFKKGKYIKKKERLIKIQKVENLERKSWGAMRTLVSKANRVVFDPRKGEKSI